ncbi:MAG: class I SAM-dependent methyltransferase [Xenococcaceae cyanobacterium MO_207.B15]|nr:class I SAM-dependent methyltransferase [Xenococcaceae cyanobacterium MO_207.B15]
MNILRKTLSKKTKAIYYPDSDQTYFHDEKLGLIGRRKGTDIATRFFGLETIAQESICKNSSLLDLGCAEGLISYEFFKKGITKVHGFDIQNKSIKFANKLFADTNIDFYFSQADISKWENLENNHKILELQYDIVLFLGIYHHILKISGEEIANQILSKSLIKTKKYFAIRTNTEFPKSLVLDLGFISIKNDIIKYDEFNTGKLYIFKRES